MQTDCLGTLITTYSSYVSLCGSYTYVVLAANNLLQIYDYHYRTMDYGLCNSDFGV